MGADTDAARAEVLASRAVLLEEMQRLEASARAAVDIPAKIRRQPAKAGAIAAGTAFVVLGGPRRLIRRAGRVVRRPSTELPKSLLPEEIEKSVLKLGTDGDKIRGTLEREFMRYLDERAKVRRDSSVASLGMLVAKNVLRPLSFSAGRRLASELFTPETGGYDQAMARAKARYEAVRRNAAAPRPAPSSESAAGASVSQSVTEPSAGRTTP